MSACCHKSNALAAVTTSSNTASANNSTTSNSAETTSNSAETTTMSQPQIQLQQQLRTFYRRPLPETCIALSSQEGQARFASAMATHGLKSFFPLIEQFSTQSEPAYCGVSTLVVVLNALAVDPRRTWKGPWRWYEESMLNCCLDMETVKQTGITIGDFRCLAMCQGLAVQTVLVQDLMDDTNDNDKNKDAAVEQFRNAVRRACVSSDNENNNNNNNNKSEILVVSYCRKILGQTGSGHFSPIAAYDSASDSVLILDVARFKYGAHWVSVPLLFDAMKPVDPDSGKSRGFLLLSEHDPASDAVTTAAADSTTLGTTTTPSLLPSVLFLSQRKQNPVRRQYKEFLSSLQGNEPDKLSASLDLDQVISFWTEDGSKPSFIWSMLEPQLTPLKEDKAGIALIESVRSLVNQLLKQVPHKTPPKSCCECRINFSRTLDLTPLEAMFVVYLASLDDAKRKETVLSVDTSIFTTSYNKGGDDAVDITQAQMQLLAEAELIRYAIDMSDEIE